MNPTELREAAVDLITAAKRLLYWADVECAGAQLRDLNDAKAILSKWQDPVRNELHLLVDGPMPICPKCAKPHLEAKCPGRYWKIEKDEHPATKRTDAYLRIVGPTECIAYVFGSSPEERRARAKMMLESLLMATET